MTMAAGASLFLDALRQLWLRRAEVLPILAVPLGALVLLEFITFFAAWHWAVYSAAFFLVLVWFLVPAWVAVFWHRYILLDEAPSGILPPWQSNLIFPYMFVGVFVFFLIGIVVFVPMLLLYFLLLDIGEHDFVLNTLLAVVSVPFNYLFLRFGLIFPHLALGRGWFGLGESWRQTSGMGGGLWVIAILNGLAFFLPALLPSIEAGAGYILITLISTLMIVIGTLIGISILTRLYDYAGQMAPEHGETI